MNKKIIASILSAGFVLSSASAFARLPQDVEGTRFETAVSVLSALKIMNGDENGEYRLDDTIIRSELTKMAVTAMGMEDAASTSKGATPYTDVKSDHWASGYINVATNLGLIEGDGDGNFRPNDEITYREAVAIMVRAAGYSTAAESRGGYPEGYITVARENKQLTGVEGSTDADISRGNVAILTNNTLTTKKMEQTGFGSYPEYSIVDKTLLSDNLRTEKINGQIMAVGQMALNGTEKLTDGEINIGGTVYKSEYPSNNLLGYNVTAYAQKDAYNEKNIILAVPQSGKNNTAELHANDFVELTTKNGKDAVVYYPDSSSKEKTAVIENGAQIIYNNRGVEYSRDLIDISDKSAFMTVLDTDGDSEFDIVFITEYKNMIAEYATAQKIVGMNGDVIKLDEIDYKLYQGFNEAEPKDIARWDVLSIVKTPQNDYYEIYVTRNTVNGKVSAKTENGYNIGGKVYGAAKDLEDTITIGQTAEFCLDINGDIAAVKSVSNVSSSYAYLLNAYKSTDGESVEIKLFDKGGKEQKYTLANKVKVNGSSVTANELLETLKPDGSVARQLVTFKTNSSDKITELNIANDKSGSGAVDTDRFTLNKKLENAVYNSATSKLDNVRVTTDTVVFDISDIKNITISDKSIFSDNQSYTGFVYDMTENYNAGVIVLTDRALKPETDASLAVVTGISKGMNDNDEDIDIVKVFVDGKETELNAIDDKTLVKGAGKKLEAGDIIQYKLNSKGEIAGIRVLFDKTAKSTEFINEIEDDMHTVYGKVTKKFSDSVNVSVNDSTVVNYAIGEGVRISSIDTDNSKKPVSTASFGDIAVYDEDEGNRIFVKIIDEAVKEVVIIK